jgi:ectoine hydroxylase-related dioxygenase (phytanoyl-CoA dioxygenase family)
MPEIDAATIEAFRQDGAVALRGVLPIDWIDTLRRGLERNIATPGPYTRHYTKPGDPGDFFGDYCNWDRIPEYRDFLFDSPAAALAGRLMGCDSVVLFHEHVLVKEPGTRDRTPWHHDAPYYCTDTAQSCSLWIPLDPVARESCVEYVAGSHRWGKLFMPAKFRDNADYSRSDDGLERVPDIDAERGRHRILAWDLEPGDCIAFDFLTVHGAPGNASSSARRRAFAARFLGGDARYVRRAGEMSPPFPAVTLAPGEPMRNDRRHFPVVFGR